MQTVAEMDSGKRGAEESWSMRDKDSEAEAVRVIASLLRSAEKNSDWHGGDC